MDSIRSGEVRMHQHKITAGPSDHVFIIIECEGRPTVSLDLMNMHGRRSIGVRSDGMGIGGILVDVEPLAPASATAFFRYCSMCGEELNLVSSKSHVCEGE